MFFDAQVAAPARKRSNFPSQADSDETAVATTKAIPLVAPEQESTAVGKTEDSMHNDILSTIYGAGPEQDKGVTAKEAAAANLDRCALLDWTSMGLYCHAPIRDLVLCDH